MLFSVVANSCGATVNQNNTQIQNAGFPNVVMNRAVSCRYTIEKCSSDVSFASLDDTSVPKCSSETLK